MKSVRGGGGLLLEPGLDVADVAAEDGARLLDVFAQQHHRRANPHHRQDQVGQRHRLKRARGANPRICAGVGVGEKGPADGGGAERMSAEGSGVGFLLQSKMK